MPPHVANQLPCASIIHNRLGTCQLSRSVVRNGAGAGVRNWEAESHDRPPAMRRGTSLASMKRAGCHELRVDRMEQPGLPREVM
jgi:hypothetical protein